MVTNRGTLMVAGMLAGPVVAGPLADGSEQRQIDGGWVLADCCE